MNSKTKLVKNVIILFIGTIGTKLINFIMLPFYTGWLSVEEYGTIDIFTSVISLAVPICTLQIEQAVFRFMIDEYKNDNEVRSSVSSGFTVVTVICILVSLVGLPLLIFKKNYLYLIYLIAVIVQAFYVMLQYVVRGCGKNQCYTISSLILAFVNLGFSIVFIRFCGFGVYGYVAAFIIGHFVAGLYLAFASNILRLYSIKLTTVGKIKRLLNYSIPMIANNVSWWILNLSDKFVLNVFCGVNANGIYAASGKIPGLITTIYSVFHLAWQESISREKDSKEIETFISDIFNKIFAIMSFGAVILLLLGREFFTILVDTKFDEAYNYMPILILSMWCLSLAQYLGGLYVGLKLPKQLGNTSMIAAAINLLIDLLAVQWIGIYAASFSTLFAYLFLLIYRVIDVRKFYKISYHRLYNTVVILFLVLCLYASYRFNIVHRIILLILGIIIFLAFYRKEIAELCGFLKSGINRIAK